jgi:hypothetical protein
MVTFVGIRVVDPDAGCIFVNFFYPEGPVSQPREFGF